MELLPQVPLLLVVQLAEEFGVRRTTKQALLFARRVS